LLAVGGNNSRLTHAPIIFTLVCVRHRVAQATVALSLILTVGGHWFFLQSVAWAGMFAKFSQSCSVTEALVKTFNGKNPCKLCLTVQQGKKSEQKQETINVETKLDFFLVDRTAICLCPGFGNFELTSSNSDLVLARFERPPTPPPRLA
jgi:hypothetical protein